LSRYFNNSAAHVLNTLESFLQFKVVNTVATGEKNDYLVWTMHKPALLT
jgi:hypothetical protein